MIKFAINKTIWQVIAMYGASGLGMVLGVLISIFNTRVLGTASFGDLKFIETVARFMASLTTAGFFVSITRLLAINDSREYQKKMLGYFVVILIIMGVIASVLVFIFSYLEPIYFDNGTSSLLRKYFFIAIAILAIAAVNDILRGLNYIYMIVLLGLVPGILYLSIAYPTSLYSKVSLEVVLSLQYGILILVSALFIIKLKPNLKYGKEIVRQVYEENKTNGKPIYFGGLAGVATTYLAGFSISYFLDNTQVGFYMLALTICSPLLVIPSVLGTTFFKQFANIHKIPNKIILLTLAISIPVMIIFYFIVEDIIIYFYTDRYLPAAEIAKILIIAFLLHGLGDLLNRFLGAKGLGKLLRNAAFIVGGVNILGYTILAHFFEMKGVILTRIIASFTYFLIMLIFYSKFVKNKKHVQK